MRSAEAFIIFSPAWWNMKRPISETEREFLSKSSITDSDNRLNAKAKILKPSICKSLRLLKLPEPSETAAPEAAEETERLNPELAKPTEKKSVEKKLDKIYPMSEPVLEAAAEPSESYGKKQPTIETK